MDAFNLIPSFEVSTEGGIFELSPTDFFDVLFGRQATRMFTVTRYAASRDHSA